MRFWGKHGASDEERRQAQPIDVDLEVSVDLTPAAVSDRLRDAIDYTKLFEICERVVTKQSFALLEALARHIGERICEDDRVLEVVVRVRKPRLLDGATPEVEMRIRRADS
jgi:7,8-dihydroneopterin aldolase/epimerase/oxygenase